MEFEERLNDHYKRWNIDGSEEEQFVNFKNRLIEIINTQLGDYLALNSDIDWSFREKYKIHEADEPNVKRSRPIMPKGRFSELISQQMFEQEYTEKGFGDTQVYQSLYSCKSSKELATATQILFWTLEEKYDEIQEQVSNIVESIQKISILTPSVGFAIHQNGKYVTIYPPGDKFLDEGVINVVLSGLEKYPYATEEFTKALKIYQNAEISQYRNLLDNLRFSLEQLVKAILGNQKSLENQKPYLLPWIKHQELNAQVVNLYASLLTYYEKYQNEASKHDRDFSEDEVEFMIYLTGNFMRLLLQLEAKEKNN